MRDVRGVHFRRVHDDRIVRERHELRSAINAVRTLAAMQAGTFTNTIIAGATVRALDFSELRTGLAPALSALTLPAITFAHTTLQANVSLINAIDVTELRDAIR